MRRRRRSDSGEDGWALVSVLWAVTALSLLAVAAQDLSLAGHRSERLAFDRSRAEAALHAALLEAVAGISAPQANERWRVDGVERRIEFGGLRISVAVQAEIGRYDLNAIDPGTLGTLLRAVVKLEPADANRLSASIVTWRSPVGPHQLNGATGDDYAAAGRSYRPRHGAFQSVDELRLVLGMTPAIFNAISPALTVYTHRGMVDPSFATREALLALYAGDQDQLDAVLQARAAGTAIPSTLYVGSAGGIMNVGTQLAGQSFSVMARTWIGEREYQSTTVVTLTGDDRRPFFVRARSS